MKYILIILISLFISLPSFANPSGKGLICECVKCDYSSNKRKIGFEFTDETFTRYSFNYSKDIIKIFQSGSYTYTTYADSIRFQVATKKVVNGWNVVTNYLLKRKSLKLKAATRTGIKSTYQCKIIVGEDEFLKEIDNIQKAYQKELDLELKANKI